LIYRLTSIVVADGDVAVRRQVGRFRGGRRVSGSFIVAKAREYPAPPS